MEVKVYKKPHTTGEGGTIIYNGGYGASNSNYNSNVLNVTTLNASTVNAKNVRTENVRCTNVDTEYIKSGIADIDTLNSDNISTSNGYISNLSTNDLGTNNLTVNDLGNINQLLSNKITAGNITTDYLNVNKSAHFFELIIDKMRSVQGTQINTAANCVADYVEKMDVNDNVLTSNNNVDHYRVYWKNTDDNRRKITNDWLINDQAICQSFFAKPGLQRDVHNKYYWRLVENTSNEDPSGMRWVNLNSEYENSDKVSENKPNFSITFFTGFTFSDGNTDLTDFTIQPDYAGEWNQSTMTWTPTNTQYGLKIFNNDMSMIDGSFYFETYKQYDSDPNVDPDYQATNLTITIVYEDGTLDFTEIDTYEDSWSIATQPDRYVSYFYLTINKIETWDQCHWIDLSENDRDTSTPMSQDSYYEINVPEPNDNICQLGYRWAAGGDKDRASAIIIAAYNTPDPEIVPPSYAQYQGIRTYNLSTYRRTFFDAVKSEIYGSFKVDAIGDGSTYTNLDDYIHQNTQIQEVEVIAQDLDGASYSMIVLQATDGTNKISGMNNFPPSLYLKLNNYSSSTPFIQDLNCELFGRQFQIMYNNQFVSFTDSADGIYLSQAGIHGTSAIFFNFAWRGTGNTQTIASGTNLKFWGTITLGSDTYQVSYVIPITILNSAPGHDGELYQLYKMEEMAKVDSQGHMNCKLKYSVQHILGSASSILTNSEVTSGGYSLRIKFYDITGNTVITDTLSANAYNNGWTYTYPSSGTYDWYGANPRPVFINIELLDNNNTTINIATVNIINDPAALFTVENGLMQSIQTAVTPLSNQIGGLQTNYSALNQTVTGINTTVQSQTTTLSELNSRVGGVEVEAGQVRAYAESTQTDLTNLTSYIQYAGITLDGVNSYITLDAAKTYITGNLNIGGNFESYNAEYMNRTQINTNSSHNQGLVMRGPNSIDTQTGLPLPGAEEIDLVRLDFTATSGQRSGQLTLFNRGNQNNYMQIDSQSISINKSNGYTELTQQRVNTNGEYKNWEDIVHNRLGVKYLDNSQYNYYYFGDNAEDNLHSVIIVNTTAAFTLYLPVPSSDWEGKILYIKQRTNNTLKIKIKDNSSRIIDEADNDTNSEYNIGNDSMTFICADNCWITFRAT